MSVLFRVNRFCGVFRAVAGLENSYWRNKFNMVEGMSTDGSAADKSEVAKMENLPREINFVDRINCTTGKHEWVEVPHDYDYHTEISRSAYADMLHDHDRNMRYFEALRYEIGRLKSLGQPAHVLDIGTGTGLLSMMAVVAGATSVVACDAFTPMLECAKKVIARNGFEKQIKLIPKRSTELVVGVDLPHRCNLLVTEVFDTELIGEGAISTFNHAHAELLTDPCVVIPRTSIVYAQVMDSPEVVKWNSLPERLQLSSLDIKFPSNVRECSGVPSVQDLQLDAIQKHEFKPLSPPIPIFEFDFEVAKRIPMKRNASAVFRSEADGNANTVFLWWDLDMDSSGENILSCQPEYVKSGPKAWFDKCLPQDAAWRDHWMHSVYYIPRNLSLKCRDEITCYSAHDEYSFWFDVVKTGDAMIQFPSQHPVCECRVHIGLSRYQIYLMNDNARYEALLHAYRNKVGSGTVCLCISDCSLLPIVLSNLGAKVVYVLDDNQDTCKSFNLANGVHNVKFVDTKFLNNEGVGDIKIDLVTGDPYFQSAVYPWNNLRFWYEYKSVRADAFAPNVKLAPFGAVIRGIGVNFVHLWKIKAPVAIAAGQFNLTDFDELIKNSSAISDSPVDAQPLWEYEGTATSGITDFISFDFSKEPEKVSSTGEMALSGSETNGVAIWIDWRVTESEVLSTGPKSPPALGEKLTWERFCKQGVYFVTPRTNKLDYTVSFNNVTGDVDFNFI
ncbi:Protein arginine N-methyltransferase 7 [Orchesella cincta]|uniref:Protein arginine N-methyltransferase n=1 Tax=Orchesella cincta TaxID=48709 RepID=A0A1D2NBX5_ORCCI|nr:Protein arginine N-methyltransferase 7 [Orchesella cincta]